MKKYILITLASLVIISACKQEDKQSKLEKLKKQHDQIASEIKKLEEEINKESKNKKDKVVLVGITDLKPSQFRHFIEVQGKIDGDQNVGVNPKVPGTVIAIYVKEGQAVRAGQVLCQLDDKALQQSYIALKGQYDFAKNVYDKQKRLWDQKIGSEIQYLSAKTQMETLENNLKAMEEQIAMYKITSPINGTVEDMPLKIGQSVAPGYPVFRVINFSTVKATADVAEGYVSKINTGDSVYVSIPDFGIDIPSKISFASKYINTNNRTFLVESKLNPGKFQPRANMIAVLKIVDYKSVKALVLPVSVIQKSSNETFVYVVKDEKGKKIARKQNVKPGLTYNGNSEITEGLQEGDQVITTGFQELIDGQTVKF